MSFRLFASTAVLACSSASFAAPGDHIRAGDATFTPSIDVGAEYRTNLYRAEVDPTGGANLRIAPQASLTVAGEDHSFKASGIWELRKFLFVQTDPGDTLSGADRVSSLDRFNDFGVGASASLFRREVVGLELSDNLALRNTTTDADFAEAPFTTQLRNTLAGGLRINPGPALKLTPGGVWSFNQYKVPGDIGDRLLNTRHTYGPTLTAGWAFLPRTSLYANTSYMLNHWVDGPVADSVASAALSVPDSQFVQAMTGLDGRFTDRLFLNVGVGYGVGIYETGANASGLAGLLFKAQGRYQIKEATTNASGQSTGGIAYTLGYDKQFRDSFFTNFVEINRIFTGFNAGIGNFYPSLGYEIRFEDYNGTIERADIVNRFNADLAYKLQSWASITPGVNWQQRASNTDNVEYDDVNIHLLATFTY